MVTTTMAIWARLRGARVALLAAGLSYYILVSILPALVLGTAVLGYVSQSEDALASDVVDWLGVEGQAATLVVESIDHAEQSRVTSSVVGLAGLLWAALAVTGALRRAVDAVWGIDDVGWTARLRAAPWAVVAAVLVASSLLATTLTTAITGTSGVLATVIGIAATAAGATWFLARLGTRRPTKPALWMSVAVLTVGFEAVKVSAVYVVPRLISRQSALYGGLGSALAALAVVLVIAWLLLIATAIAAELSEPASAGDGATEPMVGR